VKNENGESQSKDYEKWDIQTLYALLEGLEHSTTMLNLEMQENKKTNGSIATYKQFKVFVCIVI